MLSVCKKQAHNDLFLYKEDALDIAKQLAAEGAQ